MINWRKKKSRINLVIDAIMMVLLMAIAGLGFLLKYVLLPGHKRNEVYGRDTELYFLNLSRHDWGDIHLYLSLSFLFLILLHIILHWKLIIGIFKRMISIKNVRIGIAIFIGAVSIFFALGPFTIKPEIRSISNKNIHSQKNYDSKRQARQLAIPTPMEDGINKINEKPEVLYSDRHDHEHVQDDIEIFGFMTLNEVADKYNIPADLLAETVNLPKTRTDERLGRLKREYGFTMSDIENAIRKIKTPKP